jgi:quinoprotein glucose dehydrogenase
MADERGRGPVLWIAVVVTALIGIALVVGGAWLVALGGSWYYLAAGLAFLVTAGLLAARRPEALWLYALVTLGTLLWSLWEVGFDWWPLAARGDIVFLVGILQLTPWVTGRLRRGDAPARPWQGAALPLALSLVLAAAAGIWAIVQTSPRLAGSLQGAQASAAPPAGVAGEDWTAYGGSAAGDRWSSLADITPQNAGNLQVAWTYHTGDLAGPQDPVETTYEVTPLKVGNLLYVCTPHDWAIALDAETGKEVWKFDPKIEQKRNLQHLTCRGLSYHAAAAGATGPCAARLFLPTADARLFALDALTGRPCQDFGKDGAVDLWQGMPMPHSGMYYSTSPPLVTKDLVIVGGEVTDNYSVKEPSGVVRAYDAATGRLVWNWDPGNPDATEPLPEGQTYTMNSPNYWSVGSVDEALGLLYLPMGNQPPDQWGGERSAQTERFSSSIVALDIATGKVRWVFQTVHHDLWDMDIGSQPSLVDLDTDHGKVPALVAPTKTGNLFVLDRRTGEPIIPVKEQPAPQGAAKGDKTAPTQPASALSFMPQDPVEGSDMWGATMFDQLACRISFRSLRYDGAFTPPSVQGSLVFPGNFGVFDWGGIAVDPVRQVAFAAPSYMAFVDRLVPREQPAQPPPVTQTITHEFSGNPNYGAPFAADLAPFLSPLGLPCQAPPWGYVAGVDLRSGKVVWMHKNGTIRDSSPVPLPFKMGVPSLGGPLMTAGGVAFLTSTLDYYVRAYDVTSGAQLWENRLPAGGQATPMTYRSPKSGRQFVIVVAGGHGSLGTAAGDAVIAYALPKSG